MNRRNRRVGMTPANEGGRRADEWLNRGASCRTLCDSNREGTAVGQPGQALRAKRVVRDSFPAFAGVLRLLRNRGSAPFKLLMTSIMSSLLMIGELDWHWPPAVQLEPGKKRCCEGRHELGRWPPPPRAVLSFRRNIFERRDVIQTDKLARAVRR